MASVVAARIDEVAFGKSQALPLGAQGRRAVLLCGRRAARPHEFRSWREWDDLELLPSDSQQAPRCTGDGLGPHDDRSRLAQEPAPQALAEAAGDRPLVCTGQLPGRQVEERDDRRRRG